jgi:hypothetical protein
MSTTSDGSNLHPAAVSPPQHALQTMWPPISRRRALGWVAGTGGGLVAGLLLGRAWIPAPSPVSPQATFSPKASPVPSMQPVTSLLRLLLNLRPVKPYDLGEPELNWISASGAGGDVAYRFTEGGPSVSIPVSSAGVMTVSVPKTYGPIRDVMVSAAAGERVPTLERLRDIGIPTDISQIEAAKRSSPLNVGDLWVLIPRDDAWVAGSYEVIVHADASEARFTFGLV